MLYRCAHCLTVLALDPVTGDTFPCPVHPDGGVEVHPEVPDEGRL